MTQGNTYFVRSCVINVVLCVTRVTLAIFVFVLICCGMCCLCSFRIVAVDEMDILVTKKQSVLYNFFDWPTRKGVPLVVIGISNTLNLPDQMMARITSRLGQ